MTSLMKKATSTRTNDLLLPEVIYKKYHVTRRYLRENDSKCMSIENTTLTCSHLVMVKLIPLVQDLEAWKHHFREMAKGNWHGQYVVKGLGSQTKKNPINIKMVSPTEAAVERAKALVHLEKKENKPTEKRKMLPLL